MVLPRFYPDLTLHNMSQMQSMGLYICPCASILTKLAFVNSYECYQPPLCNWEIGNGTVDLYPIRLLSYLQLSAPFFRKTLGRISILWNVVKSVKKPHWFPECENFITREKMSENTPRTAGFEWVGRRDLRWVTKVEVWLTTHCFGGIGKLQKGHRRMKGIM